MVQGNPVLHLHVGVLQLEVSEHVRHGCEVCTGWGWERNCAAPPRAAIYTAPGTSAAPLPAPRRLRGSRHPARATTCTDTQRTAGGGWAAD